MRRLLRRWSGLSLLAALVVPLGAVFYFSVSDAQTRPGGIPIPRPMPFPPRTTLPPGPVIPPGTTFPPPGTTMPPGTTFPPPGTTIPPGGFTPGGFTPPTLERKWVCTGCRNTIGTGDFPPAICPFCNAKIINGRDGISTMPMGPGFTPPGMGPGFTPPGFTPPGPGPVMPTVTTPVMTPPITAPLPTVTTTTTPPVVMPTTTAPVAPRTAAFPAPVLETSDGLGGGAIAAIVIGSLAIIGLIAAGVKVLNS